MAGECLELGGRAVQYSTVARWVQAFKCGRVPTAGLHRCGRFVSVCPVMSVAIVTEQYMDEDGQWTVKELAEHAVVSEYSALNFTTGLNMRKTAA